MGPVRKQYSKKSSIGSIWKQVRGVAGNVIFFKFAPIVILKLAQGVKMP